MCSLYLEENGVGTQERWVGPTLVAGSGSSLGFPKKETPDSKPQERGYPNQARGHPPTVPTKSEASYLLTDRAP